MMIKTVDKIVDIDIFQDVFGSIDKNFIKSIVSIASLFEDDGKNFLMMTKDSTFAYGDQICKMLSLKHDSSRPQPISSLNDMKIIQVDSGDNFVVLLTDDGLVYLASNDDVWDTKKTFKLITVSNDDDRFKMIACGESDFLLLRQDGTVFKSCDSSNDSEKSRPKRIEPVKNLKNVKLIACGKNHWFALTKREKLYLWGKNYYGQSDLDYCDDISDISDISGISDISLSQSMNVVPSHDHSADICFICCFVANTCIGASHS